MDTHHYEAAVEMALADGVVLPVETRRVGATPWDPALESAMERAGRIVHEERLLDDIFGDD
jgi:hypothetical protein